MNKLNLPGLPGLPTPATASQTPALGLPGLGAPLGNTLRPAVSAYSRLDRQIEERYAHLFQAYNAARMADPAHNRKATRAALGNLVRSHYLAKDKCSNTVLANTLWYEAILASDEPYMTLDEVYDGVPFSKIAPAYEALSANLSKGHAASLPSRYLSAWSEWTRLNEAGRYQDFYKKFIRNQNSSDPYIAIARAQYYLATDPSASIAALEKVLAFTPDHPAVLLQKAVVLEHIDDHEQAVNIIDSVIAQQPEWQIAHQLRGVSLFNLKRYDESFAATDIAIALREDATAIKENKARMKKDLATERRVEKINKWRASPDYRSGPRQKQAELDLTNTSRADAVAPFHGQHSQEATDKLEAHLQTYPDDQVARAWQALALKKLGHMQKAEQVARKAFDAVHDGEDSNLGKCDPVVIFAYCDCLLSRGQLPEAEAYFEIAREQRSPEERLLRYTKAKILWQKSLLSKDQNETIMLKEKAIERLESLVAPKHGMDMPTGIDLMMAEDLITSRQELMGNYKRIGYLEKILAHQSRTGSLLEIFAPLMESNPVITLAALRASYEKAAARITRDIAEPSRITPDVSRHHATFCELSVRLHGEDDELRDQLLDVTPRRGFLNAVIDKAFDELPAIPGTGVDLILSRGAPTRPATPNIPNIIKDHSHD